MKILIKTQVADSHIHVFKKFNKSLFEKLAPPLVQLNVLRFDGCEKGDQVHLEIGLGPLKQKWVSLITEDQQTEEECFFIDEGSILPPPLKSWKHRHRIIKIDENTCEIHDDIDFSTGNQILDLAIYPILYSQFYLRIPTYKKLGK